jgi:hypothetical protein
MLDIRSSGSVNLPSLVCRNVSIEVSGATGFASEAEAKAASA